MTRIIESRRRLKSRLDAKQDVSRPIPALMGDGNGNIEIDPVNHTGDVYIRVGDGDLGRAFNNRVPLVDNLAIDIGYDPITDPDRRIFQVLSVRMADYAGGGNTPYPNLPNHHEMHEFGGGDDVYLSWRRLMGLRVGRPSGYSVTVDEGFILRAGAWLAVLAQTLDLTASKPALATQARYVLITLNSAGVATSTDGALVAVGALDISDCPIPAAGEIPLAAVRMYGTQTSIGDVPSAPDIIDLRFPQAASTGSVYLADLEKGTAQYQIITSGPNPYPATWSAFKIQGTANGITNLAVTAAKTLTLTSADDFNLTAERTGAVIVRTVVPNIVAGTTGNARGDYAVDFQLSSLNPTYVASGQFSVIPGGIDNTASGWGSVAFGGGGNVAAGAVSFACGFRAKTGANDGVFIWGDNTNEDFNGIVAREFAIRARGGFRHAYDDSNYWQATISAAGAVTFNATGASAGFAFSDVVTIPAAGLVVTGMARGDLLTGNATPAFGRLAKGAAYAVLTGDGTDTAWSTYLLDGTAGGKTVLAVTNTKTLTLTSIDDFNLTIPKTGTAVTGTGTAGRVAAWVTDSNTIQAAALIAPASNILTLTATAASTLAMAISAGKTVTLTATDNSGITFTGACVLTVPTAGAVTAALLETANVFTANQAVTLSTNGALMASVNNANAGASATAILRTVSDTVTGNFTAYSAAAAGGARLNVTAAGGYMLLGTTTNHRIDIYTNNVIVATFAAAGGLTIANAVTLSNKITTYNGVVTEGYGVPAIVDDVALTNQGADIAATNFTNAGTAGEYEVTGYIVVTTADAAAGGVGVNILWNDGTAARTLSFASVVLTATNYASAIAKVHLASGSVQYQTIHVGNYGTAKYALYLTCKRLN